MTSGFRRLAALATSLACLGVAPLSRPAQAQKNSGPLLPVETARPAAPGPMSPMSPMGRPPRPLPASPVTPGQNPAVERLAERLPLDPATRTIRDRMPPDPVALERQLRLHPARGPVTDLRGRTPTPGEIVNALAPR